MTKKKKPDPKPTPPAADIIHDKSDFLAHADSPVLDDAQAAAALARQTDPVVDFQNAAFATIMANKDSGAFDYCPVCGTARSSFVCPVDGHRFEAK